MKRALALVLFLLLLKVAAAQDLRTGVMHPYPDSPGLETPAPAGYKPFYISHFGRHGSRYLSAEKSVLPALKPLLAAHDEGSLTPAGEKLLGMVLELHTSSAGMWGYLSPLGVEEHKNIARRMVRRCPSVFVDSVRVQSSVYPRCILSMAASAGEIARLAPKTKWSYKSGKRYQSIINTGHRPADWVPGARIQREYIMERLDPDETLARIFIDPVRGKETVGNPAIFFRAVYQAWSDREAIGLQPFDLDAILGKATVDLLAASDNLAHYRNMAFPNADSLVTDIVLRADAALAGKKPSADLRYGHDNGLMRLLVQIGMDGYPVGLDNDQAAAFCFGDRIPLAANLQMVFYRNRKGNVLVKFLVNEKESALNALSGGPYYKWEDVRSILDKHCLK